MRGIGLALGFAGWMALIASPILAQQRPTYGCNAAPSCRPLGVSGLNNNPGASGMFFGVGMAWGPGFDVHTVGPHEFFLVQRKPTPVQGEIFHLRVSLLPLLPSLTPAPTPTPPPSASKEPPKD
jgi:hypothetical protein